MNYGAPLQLPFGDEGRAMMQIVHDVAPGASLAFYTAENSEADFASGIVKLAAPVASGGAGAKIVVDDVGYFDEPFFQDGLVAQAITQVVAQGVAYFSSAGNNGTLAYNNNTSVIHFRVEFVAKYRRELLNFASSGDPDRNNHQAASHHSAHDPGRIRRDRGRVGPTLRDGGSCERRIDQQNRRVHHGRYWQRRHCQRQSTSGDLQWRQHPGPRSRAGHAGRQSGECHGQQLAGDTQYRSGCGERHEARAHQSRSRG